ncbi:hypothetical protein SNEBB_010083 [Seison nebaliae]|nr:hypothetical protein SNEBB_010083 [Seison nebaliae]
MNDKQNVRTVPQRTNCFLRLIDNEMKSDSEIIHRKSNGKLLQSIMKCPSSFINDGNHQPQPSHFYHHHQHPYHPNRFINENQLRSHQYYDHLKSQFPIKTTSSSSLTNNNNQYYSHNHHNSHQQQHHYHHRPHSRHTQQQLQHKYFCRNQKEQLENHQILNKTLNNNKCRHSTTSQYYYIDRNRKLYNDRNCFLMNLSVNDYVNIEKNVNVRSPSTRRMKELTNRQFDARSRSRICLNEEKDYTQKYNYNNNNNHHHHHHHHSSDVYDENVNNYNSSMRNNVNELEIDKSSSKGFGRTSIQSNEENEMKNHNINNIGINLQEKKSVNQNNCMKSSDDNNLENVSSSIRFTQYQIIAPKTIG